MTLSHSFAALLLRVRSTAEWGLMTGMVQGLGQQQPMVCKGFCNEEDKMQKILDVGRSDAKDFGRVSQTQEMLECKRV